MVHDTTYGAPPVKKQQNENSKTPEISSDSGEIVISDGPFAMFLKRCAALVLDLIIIGALFLLVYVLMFEFVISPIAELPDIAEATDPANTDVIRVTRGIAAVYVVLCFLPILYFSIFEASRLRATLGKRLIDIVVVGPESKRLSYPRSLLRAVVKFVTIVIFLPVLPFTAIPIFFGKRRSLHDFAAGTLVEDSHRRPY
jgi:uncharacterized RDD family membrane protein YckC